MVAYLEQLPAGENASARSYLSWATGHPERPSLDTITKRIGWSRALGEARRVRGQSFEVSLGDEVGS